jgi:hypothetical protein
VGAPDPIPVLPSDGDDPPAPPFDIEVCPRCLADGSPFDSFCRHCGAPAFGIATLGFFETNLAGAWAFGEVVGRRDPTLVVLIGGILLMAWFFVVPGSLFLAMASSGVATAGAVGFLGVGVYLMTRMVSRFLRNRRGSTADAS